ncbi:MAG: transcriptional regulator, partial [Armatimonadetes bacterium]|nr:transcriptional regulator [Armatimonadota bacterium]
KILSIDNTREDIHRELILLYGKIGNRPAAARQYCDCERILKEELGISPSPTTTDAFRHVVAAR